MKKRPDLDTNISIKDLNVFYYLKEELVEFCKKNHLSRKGTKLDIKARMILFLETGESTKNNTKRKKKERIDLSLETLIEPDFCFSELKRKFFKKYLGESFKFNVKFQKWVKSNVGLTYKDAIEAYKLLSKNNEKSSIDPQFEYNTYIRDFFATNKNKTLKDAIKCWKYKKSLPGNHKYAETDLIALE